MIGLEQIPSRNPQFIENFILFDEVHFWIKKTKFVEFEAMKSRRRYCRLFWTEKASLLVAIYTLESLIIHLSLRVKLEAMSPSMDLLKNRLFSNVAALFRIPADFEKSRYRLVAKFA